MDVFFGAVEALGVPVFVHPDVLKPVGSERMGAYHLRNLQHGRPSSYLRRFYYDTVVFEPTALKYLVDRVGADRVVVGTDWPFDMADPDPMNTVGRAGLDPIAAGQVLGETAAALLRLKG
jgi:predicted TIM-barrel fold metal-dependent hydrolase